MATRSQQTQQDPTLQAPESISEDAESGDERADMERTPSPPPADPSASPRTTSPSPSGTDGLFTALGGTRRRGGGEAQDPQLAASLKLARLLGGRGNPEAALEIAVQYAKDRQSFGKPIIQHQAVGHRLADLATKLEAARQINPQLIFVELAGTDVDGIDFTRALRRSHRGGTSSIFSAAPGDGRRPSVAALPCPVRRRSRVAEGPVRVNGAPGAG